MWVLFTHAFPAMRVSPRLALTSPVPECGKTTALGLLNMLVPRPLAASNMSAATIFRVIEHHQPTLLIDEADTFLKGDELLAGVLNSGHTQDTAYVWRCEGDDHNPIGFSTWAPLAIAKIGAMPPALSSRSILIRMRRARADETIEKLGPQQEDLLHVLARKAARWVGDRLSELRKTDPQIPESLNGRTADNWRPLLAIADLTGGHWPKTARRIALELSAAPESPPGVKLLAAIREVFHSRSAERLGSADLCTALKDIGDGFTLTQNSLASALEPFDIKPRVIRIGTRTPRGYTREQFEDAWARYLAPGEDSAPPS